MSDKDITPVNIETCPSTTHYAGCVCHEKGWENKWKSAIEMAAQAQAELNQIEEELWGILQENTKLQTAESTAMFASIARQWESRPECLERVTEQIRTIQEKLIEWGWKTVQRDYLEYATRKYSLACQVYECCKWLPFDAIPSWEEDLYCLLMEEDEERWIDCINENRPVWEPAATIRRERNKDEATGNVFAVDTTNAEPMRGQPLK